MDSSIFFGLFCCYRHIISRKGDNIEYFMQGEGKNNVILLHGWGVDKSIYHDLANEIGKKCKVYVPDFPGFGETKEPDEPLSLSDYVETLREFVVSHKIENPILIGHSFGGRVSIRYATLFDVKKLVLVSSAGIKRRVKINKLIRIYLYKFFKKLNHVLKKKSIETYLAKFGSSDYKNASPIMKKTLVNVVNEDQKKELGLIKVPALIIWGREDKVTKLKDGYLFKKLIANSGIVVIDDAGHFPFLEKKDYFNTVVMYFLLSDNRD